MFSKGRKYFRFRFHLSRVLLLAFLLNSVSRPAQAFFLPGECVEVMKNPSLASLTIDPKFQMNVKDCMLRILMGFRQTSWKAVQASIPKELKDIFGKIPNLMEKAVPYTVRELQLLCFYFVEKSVELYQNVEDLEIDYRRHQIAFPKEELTIIIDSIENDFLPPRKIEKLLEMLGPYLKELKDLLESVHKDVKKGTSYKIWSAAYGFAVVAVPCGFSLMISRNPFVNTMTCGVGIGTGVFLHHTYKNTGKTLEKLDLLWKEAVEMRKKIGKYHVILELMQLRDED